MKDPFKGITFSEPISFKEFVKSYDSYLDHCSGVSKSTDDTIPKISSQRLLQELINRKVLTEIPVGLYKEFELRRKYQKRDKPITYDGVYLLNSSEKDF
ncbi:hypothetical protein [Lactobacillus paragasseri]|uniref:Uncharacterized protein n=1 Tax=Lactobacillus paragasseri TaxID=2107999 RepID=A0ABD4ZZ22_9LACO|nr:hypothetical protein [Lactobacillus paragasseri]MDK7952110.1 hypothetical protein [Lactobacillus paragasseri]MDO6360764.1 hypothetical protein [Lactobacillus paragasseri]MDX5059219.1 hypothetical protein [Lactobacillus paragasseri]